ncbi:MAG: ATP-binding protein [Methylotenera sp.]
MTIQPKLNASDFADNPETFLPAFAGLTLKDVGEMAQLTMTRDEAISSRGVNETRRGYSNLKGIQQVDTGNIGYYMCPSYLEEWMKLNTKFYKQGNHKALVPRGLLFTGPPGTGKTLAAKYIASEFGVPLYRLDLGSMMGKFVGDSENALNAALSQIAQVSPACVILDGGAL